VHGVRAPATGRWLHHAGNGGSTMERLEAKQINDHTYYYYSRWARKDEPELRERLLSVLEIDRQAAV